MNNILLGIFFLILGLLFANMLTNICGCRDLVEGQCDTASDNCKWEFNQCLPKNEFLTWLELSEGGTSLTNVRESLNNLCILPTDIGDEGVNLIGYTAGEATNWFESNCCQPETTEPTPPLDPPSGTYKLGCSNSQITFTPSQQ